MIELHLLPVSKTAAEYRIGAGSHPERTTHCTAQAAPISDFASKADKW
jgi:hypothetical protein